MLKVKFLTISLLALAVAGCTPLKKTGKFVWNVPGNIVSGVANTGKFMWNITPKSGGQLKETAKVIWGSSTQALEEARVDAIEKTYQCTLNDCYDSVMSMARKKKEYAKKYNSAGILIEGEDKLIDTGGTFDIFINNKKKRHIVVMGIEGNVDTTEVGIFFTQPNLTSVKLEVSSLSSNAKRNVAEAVFKELDTRYSSVEQSSQ